MNFGAGTIRCAIIISTLLFNANSSLAQRGTLRPSKDRELTQSDVAEINVAVVGVRRLADVVDVLQPVFSLTPEQALKLVVPSTSSSAESRLSSFAAELKVGLMLSAAAPASSTNGLNPGQPVAPMGSLTNSPFVPGSIDPLSQYQSAASLFQQIQLLNRSLKDVPSFHTNHTAYIITVQFSLIPHQRIAPYDAYADVSFFTGSTNEPETVPSIIPLLTTEDLEQANQQQTLDKLQQLGFGLAAAFHGAGVEAAVDRLNQTLSTISDNELNSLLTVGKMSRNTIVVRLGARNQAQGTDKLNMVPETHNVAFLLVATNTANKLQLVSRTAMRNVNSGLELKGRDLKQISKKMEDLLDEYSLSENRNFIQKQLGRRHKKELVALAEKVLEDVMGDTQSSYTNFKNDVYEFFNTYSNNFPGAADLLKNCGRIAYPALWLDITKLVASGAQYANDTVSLPNWTPKLPQENLAVLYSDDAKGTLFTIGGGKALSGSWINGTLTCTNAKSTVILQPDLLDVTNGTTLVMHFPLLSSLRQGNDTNIFQPQALRVKMSGETNTNTYTSFVTLVKTLTNTTTAPPPWRILRTFGNLLATNVSSIAVSSNQAQYQFAIVLSADSTPKANYYLDIENPIISDCSPVQGNATVLGVQTNGVYPLIAEGPTNCMVGFKFGPLLPGQIVKFDLLDKDQKFIATLSQQIVYPTNTPLAPQETNSRASPQK